MKKNVVLSIVFCALCLSGLCQKPDWSVLKKELVGSYVGEIKKGLAQGKGTAIGQDSYTGDFKKGLPDGEGEYTDSKGNVYRGAFRSGLKEGKGILTLKTMNVDSVIIGYWDSDRYIGAERIIPYEISNKTGAVEPRIYSAGAGNKVELDIYDPVNSTLITNGTIIYTGQATNRTTFGRNYYEDVVFPIEFDIRYNSHNKLGTTTVANSVHIKISKPGNWIITLKN